MKMRTRENIKNNEILRELEKLKNWKNEELQTDKTLIKY